MERIAHKSHGSHEAQVWEIAQYRKMTLAERFPRGASVKRARLSPPFLLFGIVLCVWGRNVARILLFPNRWRT
jgi:hypothetical protein